MKFRLSANKPANAQPYTVAIATLEEPSMPVKLIACKVMPELAGELRP
jgi:hypothetical protein